MGMFDTMQQGAKPGLSNAPAMGAPMGTSMGNGGSFAQKQQMRANPMMQGRPGMSGQMGNLAGGAVQGMRKPMQANPMSAVGQQIPGQMGSRQQIAAKQLAAQQQAAQPGLGPSNPVQQLQQTLQAQKGLQTPYGKQESAAKSYGQAQPLINTTPEGSAGQGYGQSAMPPAYSQSKPEPTGGVQMGAASDVGLTGPMNTQETPSNLAEGPFNAPQVSSFGSYGPGAGGARMGGRGRMQQAPPFMGTPNSAGPGMQDMMQQMGGRPDVMPRGDVYGGIGPSAQLFGGNPNFGQEDMQAMGQPMQMQPQQPVVMDENGLEPRRGAR